MTYPALDVSNADSELVLAVADSFSPSAAETSDQHVSIYFTDSTARAAARAAIAEAFPHAALVDRDVDDGDWARRSQENLQPIRVGRIIVTPPWARRPEPLEVVIAPSMGFGTGHHATTRLCLHALQHVHLHGRSVLDIGTGSGVLAIAACLLGARDVIGLDFDNDAIQSARENLELNPGAARVVFMPVDVRDQPLTPSDVVTANLTGALLVQSAPLLVAAVRPGGTLIVSGLQIHERDTVAGAFADRAIAWEMEEDGWVGLAFNQAGRLEV